MAFIDYYKILGVSKDIPQDKVRAAYRKRAKQFHPDLNPDDPKAKAKFQALSEAYDVISDPEKRRKYDQYGEHWREAGAFGQGGNGSEGYQWNSANGSPFDNFDFSGFEGGGGFSSFFQDLFGNMGGSRRSRRYQEPAQGSADMNAKVDIDMYTALLGGDIIIQLNDGSKLKLKVKSGTQPGTKVRLRGKGYSMNNGTKGDLIITYNVKLPDHLSERQKELLREMQRS
ncbi:MAG: J domain-containing protein [Prevotella sp.]|nr:J domain-containing protein [Prevotella sp.]